MRGNSGAAPLKVLDEQGLATGGKRWRFIPLSKRLRDTSTRPAALPSLDFDANLTDVAPDDTSFSHFQTTLSAEADTNITATYNSYYQKVSPISVSLPLLYRNRKRLLDETLLALQGSTRNRAEATPSISRCLAALSRDLGPDMFYPFFPQVAKAIANVFTTDRGKYCPSGTPAPNQTGQSVLWDPETSVVPLFATLAEITRILLKQLSSDPQKTCTDLYPLLSNQNRRVREMTAEACVGYLVRKTRDSDSLKDLVNTLIEGTLREPTTDITEGRFVDGLGASLFESLRVPQGRLQSRASEVIKYAIQSLGTCDGAHEELLEKENKLLSVVARCFRDVARHLTHEEDFHALCDLLVQEGQTAARKKNAWRVSAILFLLRNWMRSTGRAFNTTIGRQRLRIASSFLSDCLTTFNDDSRVVYEAFGAILVLALNDESNDAHEFLDRVTSALELASQCFCRNGLLAVLSSIMFIPKEGLKSIPAPLLLKSLSGIYERLTQLCIPSNPEVPLLAAVLLFRGMRKVGYEERSFSQFRVPSLQSLIKEMLVNLDGRDDDLMKERNEDFDDITRKYAIVEFLVNVRVPGIGELFGNLLDLCESWASPRFPAVLTAFSHTFEEQSDEADDTSRCPSELHERIIALVKDALFNRSCQSASLLQALLKFVHSFPSAVKEWLLEDQEKTEKLFSILSTSLSSRSTDVRRNSASLLSSLYSVKSHDPRHSPYRPTSGDWDDIIEEIRCYSEHSGVGSLQGMYHSFGLLLSVPTSLEAIAGNERILRELVRSSRSQSFGNGTVETLTNFSIGLLRTPLRVLWDGARDLWCAMASINCTFAMQLALKYMGQCESRLLSTVQTTPTDESRADILVTGTELSPPEEIEMDAEPSKSTSSYRSSSNIHSKYETQISMANDQKELSMRYRTEPHRNRIRAPEWDPLEWQSCDLRRTHYSQLDFQVDQSADGQDSLDCVTSLVQLLKVLSAEPQHTLHYRSEIIGSFLTLNSSSCDAKGVSHVLSTFTMLLERMGGLKCCETDLYLERRMRGSLLVNLTKTNVPLQTATVRCLCVSRSPLLKPHRDSFVRLLSDKTFREELTVLTESLFKDHDEPVNPADCGEKERNVCDVLTRISFSKIRGKQSKLDSKRSAVLSFLVAKVPWQLAMPMITSLALAPIELPISNIKMNERLQIPVIKDDKFSFPTPPVQKGILFSVEAIVKHCRRAIPEEAWKRLGLGTTLLLRNSSRGSIGQAVRSRALIILSEMQRVRPSNSNFLVEEVLYAVQDSEFDTTEYTGNAGVPALMYYVDAVMSTASEECKSMVLKKHSWALKYCVQAMKNAAAGLKAVTASISVGQGLAETLAELDMFNVNNATSRLQDWTFITDVLDFTSNALRELFSWITECLIHTKPSQKTWSPVFIKALTLTKTLTKLSLPQFKALHPLADGLCTFLEKGNDSAESRSKALSAIESIISNTSRDGLPPDSKEMQEVDTLIMRLLPLLNTRDITDDQEAISSLCRIIAKSPSPDTTAVGAILQGVNAFDNSKLNEPNFDRRIESLQIINGSVKNALGGLDKPAEESAEEILLPSRQDDVFKQDVVRCGANAFLALLYGCLSAVRADDTAVRGTAGYSLSLIAKWAGSSKEEKRTLPRTRLFRILVSNVAACKTLSIRREYCRSLGELVRCACNNSSQFFDAQEDHAPEWNEKAMFSVMAGLANNNDLDADVFENLVHLQPHRRGRALRQMAKHMLELVSTASEQTTVQKDAVESFACHFALPLGLNIALERSSNEEPKMARFHKHRESREAAQKDVLIWAVDLVGTSASFLPWASYRSFLSSLLRRLKGGGDREDVNVLLKLLVSTSKVFPRQHDPRSPRLEESTSFLSSKIIPEMLSHVNASAVEGEVLGRNIQSLRSSKMERKGKDAASFRAPIAVAAAELMTCLPSQYLDSHISLLIAPLSGALRSRASGPRDEAKKALTAVILILGPKYLNYVLSQVLNSLKDGFRRDACVYVIFAVLAGIHDFRSGKTQQTTERKTFPVDSACNLLVSFLIQELESGVGESKQDFADPNTSSDRERKASLRAFKVFECVELLAENISFEDIAALLIKPFLHLHKQTTSAKLLSKIRSALKHIVQGFSRNESMYAEDALKTCYAFANRNGIVTQETKQDEIDKTLDVDYQVCDEVESINFAFQLLNTVISRNIETMKGTDERGRILQSMCEPFLPLVVRALTIGNDELALTAFRTCQKLLKLPLGGREQVGDKLSETVVDVLAARSGGVSSDGNGSSGDDLFNACLRAGAVLLHEVGPQGFELISKERVDALVNISCNCIEHGSVDSRSAALALLRAVVSRKLMIPSVYDALEKVKEMAIHSHSASLRKSCVSLSVAFLVSFPLGSKRVRQNMEFFVRNLNYDSANGRIAALQALEIIITKFPREALERESEYLFVALTAAGARDTDGECRNGALECLKKLFQKWGCERQTVELVRMGAMLAGVRCSWTNGQNEEEKYEYCGESDAIVQRAGIIGLTAGGLSGELKQRELMMIGVVCVMVLKEAGRECGWETKYCVLRCIEACIGSQENTEHELEVDEKMFWLWEEMDRLLIDKHEWVRICACRLLGSHLSAVSSRQKNVSEWKTQKGWIWCRDDVVHNTMKSLCLELEANHVSLELAEQAIKNLLCIARVVRSMEEEEEADGAKLGGRLRYLVTRMSGMATRGGTEQEDLIRRGCGLRFLIVTGTWWGEWVIKQVEGLYMRPVVRALEGGNGGNDGNVGQLHELGQKLEETILKVMKKEEYYEEYGKWVKMRKRRRGTREEDRKRRKRRKGGKMGARESGKLSSEM